MKNERERPENERGGSGSQGERLKNGWEVVGEERAETKNWRAETKFGSARSAERFAEAANGRGEAASSGADSWWRRGVGEAESAVAGLAVRHCLAAGLGVILRVWIPRAATRRRSGGC